MLAGLGAFEGLSLSLVDNPLLHVSSQGLPSVSLCVLTSFHVRITLILWIRHHRIHSFYLHHPFTGAIPKHRQILRYWGIGLQLLNSGGYDSAHNSQQ